MLSICILVIDCGKCYLCIEPSVRACQLCCLWSCWHCLLLLSWSICLLVGIVFAVCCVLYTCYRYYIYMLIYVYVVLILTYTIHIYITYIQARAKLTDSYCRSVLNTRASTHPARTYGTSGRWWMRCPRKRCVYMGVSYIYTIHILHAYYRYILYYIYA